MNKEEIKAIIGSNPPFNKLDDYQLNQLVKICQVKDYENGTVIYKEGDPPDCIYLILKGRVLVSARVGLKDSEIEIIKRGTCFGIISLLTNDPHSVTAKAIEKSYILEIEKDKFNQFLKKAPLLALDFSRLLNQRVKARSKPKRIFQSKKIGVMGAAKTGRSTYAYNLGVELKEQSNKDVVCIQVVSEIKESLESLESNKILSLKNFQEENFSEYLIKDKIDTLYINFDIRDKFISFLNFLSERYHFIIYEIPISPAGKFLDVFIKLSHQLHFLIFPQKKELKQSASTIKDLIAKNPLNKENIKVILCKFSTGERLSFTKERKFIEHPIYATLPPKDCQDYLDTINRIAKEIGEATLGLALGSGAAYGFSHIGVLKILQQEGINVDIVCGSSMGAFIAALWAADYTMEEIETFATDVGKKISSFSIMGLSLPFKGIMNAKRLEGIFRSIFRDLTFYDLKHALKIVAFNFTKRKTVILEEGPLYKAVAASCAFPGIFEPIKFKKNLLLDGGILNPLPTKMLLNYDTHKIIASNITLTKEEALREYQKRDRFHVFDFVFGSVETMQQEFVDQAEKIADVVIRPNLEGLGWMEFDKILEFIKRGEIATKAKIKEIKDLINT